MKKNISPELLKDNFFKSIGKEWMLITAGDINKMNTMTASWGGIGVFWNKPVAICLIRPTRYTLEFVDKYDSFSLSFFEEKYKNILSFIGTNSGRDVDKINETKLKPYLTELKNIGFEQARLTLECKKIYSDFIKPQNFIDSSIDNHYPLKDYHKIFIAEIENCILISE